MPYPVSVGCLQVTRNHIWLVSPYSILGLSTRRRAVGSTSGPGRASWPGHSRGQSQSCRIRSSRLPPVHSWWSTTEEQENFQTLSLIRVFLLYKVPTKQKEKKTFDEHFSFCCLCSKELNKNSVLEPALLFYLAGNFECFLSSQ